MVIITKLSFKEIFMELVLFFIWKLTFNYISYFTMIYFLDIFLNRTRSSIKSHLIWISFYTLAVGFFFLNNTKNGLSSYPEIISLVFFLIYIALFYSNSILEKLFSFISLSFLMYLIEIIVQYFILLYLSEMSFNMTFEISLLALRLLLIFLYYVFHRHRLNMYKLDKLDKSQLYFLVLILFVSFIYAFLFDLKAFDESYNNIFKIISMLVLSLLSFGSITIISRYNKEKILEYNNDLSSQQLKLQLNHYNNLERSFEETRKIKHDMKNHIICLKYLSSKKDYHALDEYINDIEESIENIDTATYTGNNVIDAIINQKYLLTKKNNITFEINASLPTEPFIQSIDICAIVSNSMDNAIEACLSLNDLNTRTIKLESFIKNNHWVYKISNSSNPISISPKTNLIETNKSDKINHGLGLKNINDSIQKYDGHIKMYYENNTFYFNTIIPIN